MTQDSFFWTTNGTGDGASGGYTQDELTQAFEQLFLGGDNQGIAKNYLNELAVSAQGGSASPVTIASGGGLVKGFPYYNDSAGTKNIPTPSSSSRIDLIVLKADWSAQTVRFDRHAGAEGGTAPSPTQSDGVTWEIPLAEVQITTGGVVTVTDRREFLHPNIEVGTGMLSSGFIGDLDGDQLDIDWNPSNYTPATDPSQADDVDDLSAHLYGIDQALGSTSGDTHASRHITGGADEVDGDKLDIDWNPSKYTPSTSPSEADSADNLTAHLKGIDDKFDVLDEELVYIRAYAFDTSVEAGDAVDYWTVPEKYDGKSITDCHIGCYTAPSGSSITGQLYNVTQTHDIMSTKPEIEASEYSSYTAASSPAVASGSGALSVGDRIRFDVDSAGTGAEGLDFIISIDMSS